MPTTTATVGWLCCLAVVVQIQWGFHKTPVKGRELHGAGGGGGWEGIPADF